jgi:hypothetical protein
MKSLKPQIFLLFFLIIIAVIIGIWINPGNGIQLFTGNSVGKNVTPGINSSQTLLQNNSFLRVTENPEENQNKSFDKDESLPTTSPGDHEYSGKIDTGLLEILKSTNQLDYVRAWVILGDPAETKRISLIDYTPAEKAAYREQQRSFYLNYTKPVVEYVRSKGFVVDYIGQTSPSVEVLAHPQFVEELAQRPDISKIFPSKTSPKVIREMEQRLPDETISVSISIVNPPEVSPLPGGSITEKQMNDYYSENRDLYKNQTKEILDLLNNEKVSIRYVGPYPTTSIWGNVPIHLIEEFNARSDIVSIEPELKYYLV